jgi:hypothetical protein
VNAERRLVRLCMLDERHTICCGPDDSGLDSSDLAENSPSAVEALNALDKMNITLLERPDRPNETQDQRRLAGARLVASKRL